MKNVEEYQNRGKVLFTGRGDLVMENMMDHMPEQYQLFKCAPTGMDLLSAFNTFRPQVIVICLLGETRESLRSFEPLSEDSKGEKNSRF